MLDKKAYEELKEKLEYLKTVKRPEIRKAIASARDHGDIKENAEFHSAKQEQSLNESRIIQLEEKLMNEEVAEERTGPRDCVEVGATVRLLDIAYKEEIDYKIAYEIGDNVFENIISQSSPLGIALMGHREDDIVEVEVPKGIIKFKILKIT